MNYPRSLAVRVLTRVLSDFQPLDEVLTAVSSEVEQECIPWLYEVCSGTLRWKGRLDSILDSVAVRKKPSGGLRKTLLLGAYQLVAQDRVSIAQVVSETVSEVKRKDGEAPARFANACLRQVAAQALAWRDQPFPPFGAANPAQAAAWGSLPLWMWNKLVHQHGLEWAQAFAAASLDRPRLWVRSRRPDWSSDWVEQGPVPGSWVQNDAGRSASGRAVVGRAGFVEGEWIVQDVSSQVLIHEVTARVREVLGVDAVSALDLCAAPGGKSVGLAWNGMNVTSTEIREDRAQLLRETLARAAPQVEWLPWSEVSTGGRTNWDLVWVDAPCSGSGILRRHPDVRWLRREEEIPRLNQSQRAVLKQGWDAVKPGGFLVYSVCSVFKEEGPQIIEQAGLKSCAVQEWLLGPQQSPFGDGFWGVLLRKSA